MVWRWGGRAGGGGGGAVLVVRRGESVLAYRGAENEEAQRSAYGYSVMTTRSLSSHQTMIVPRDWGIEPGETVTIEFVMQNENPEADEGSPNVRQRFGGEGFRMPVWTGVASSRPVVASA